MATFPFKPQNPVINWGHPLAKGLVFDSAIFERGGNTTADLSPYKLSGVFAFGNLLRSDWKQDKYGAYLNFGGTNQYLDYGLTPTQTNLNRSFSIFALVKPNTITGTHGIIGKGQGSWYFRLNVGKIDLVQSNTVDILNGNTTVANNTWVLVGMTIDGNTTGNIKFYINGAIDATGTTGVTFGNGNHFLVGCDVNSGNTTQDFWSGGISFVKLWNRALLAQEILQLYTNPFQIYYQPSYRNTKYL